MRQIGTLPRTSEPAVLGDYLLARGVTSRTVESPDGWAIWVHNEDHVAEAREALSAYERDPHDPRFADASRAAEEARRQTERLDREYRKNVRGLAGVRGRIGFRSRPLTVLLVVACAAVYLAGESSGRTEVLLLDKLLFFPLAVLAHPQEVGHGLDAIHRGELWRLFTPIFLHGGLVHLLFNVWSLSVVGTVIETHRGTARLLAMVLLSALTSNLVQYLFMVNFEQMLVPWVGISGVVYALFGYLWMKGRVDPRPGMVLHPATVRVMLLWLLLGFSGVLEMSGGPHAVRMANGAHLGGLVVGMLFGLARF